MTELTTELNVDASVLNNEQSMIVHAAPVEVEVKVDPEPEPEIVSESKFIDRSARQRALEAAKQRLQRRRKEREQLQSLRQQKQQGISFDQKNDYGKKIVQDTKQLILQFRQSTQEQEQKNEQERNKNEASVAIVPGIRAELAFVDGVNLIHIGDRDLLKYVKETQTNSLEIAQSAGLINQKTSLQEMNNILSTFIESDLNAYPDVYEKKQKKKNQAAAIVAATAAVADDNKENENANELLKQQMLEEDLLVMDVTRAEELMASESFMGSFRFKSTYLENAIGMNDDHPVFIEAFSAQREKESNVQMEKLELASVLSFEETEHRPITCLDFDNDGQRFLASYAGTQLMMNNVTDPNSSTAIDFDSPEGIISVFDLKSAKPTISLESQSMITNAQFHPTKKQMIVGSSVSGQVLGWDIRVKKTPIIRTQFSKQSHSQPIFAMKFLPSMSKIQQILTVSNDGRVCLWRDDILHDPFNSFWIRLNKTDNAMATGSQQKEIPITCLSLNSMNNDDMWFGSDEGIIYGCTLNTKNLLNNDSDDIPVRKHLKGHFGPVTSVNFHPRLPLILTSSFDWTCKLWHVSRDKPMAVFSQMQDYIYDCAWSPTQCSMFACGDGSGTLTLYDLNHSIDQPITSECIDKDVAITKIKFSPTGNNIIAGDSDGHISIYNLPTSLVESSDAYFQKLTGYVTGYLKQ